MNATIELVMCRRDHLGNKTQKREHIRTNASNAAWLAERFQREATKGTKGRKRLALQEELFG